MDLVKSREPDTVCDEFHFLLLPPCAHLSIITRWGFTASHYGWNGFFNILFFNENPAVA